MSVCQSGLTVGSYVFVTEAILNRPLNTVKSVSFNHPYQHLTLIGTKFSASPGSFVTVNLIIPPRTNILSAISATAVNKGFVEPPAVKKKLLFIANTAITLESALLAGATSVADTENIDLYFVPSDDALKSFRA